MKLNFPVSKTLEIEILHVHTFIILIWKCLPKQIITSHSSCFCQVTDISTNTQYIYTQFEIDSTLCLHFRMFTSRALELKPSPIVIENNYGSHSNPWLSHRVSFWYALYNTYRLPNSQILTFVRVFNNSSVDKNKIYNNTQHISLT